MNAGIERANGEIDVVPVRRSEIDGIDLSGAQEFVVCS
jgi:hypothetical protein